MTANKGVGLAASQVGKPIRLFVMDTLRHGGYRKAFLNAHIIASSGEEDTAEEGCLSLPDVRKRVTRKREVTVKYQDEDFNVRIEKFTGLEARVIQHEIDHIKGKLIIDYAD
jgi:peptide deformylase